MRLYAPIAKVDAEERMVWGYASTEAEDEQGEIVTRAALAAALSDYMKFANIREMHQLSAVGVATEAAIDERGLFVGARVVDDRAWAKIASGVYKGFSIGGKVRQRDPADRRVITAVDLNEISLVDRPANPEAVFDCWKTEGAVAMTLPGTRPSEAAARDPVQVWDCGRPGHRHAAKAEAVRCLKTPDSAEVVDDARTADAPSTPPTERYYADPGYRVDGRKRYPIDSDTHIRAAWAYINKPANARKYTPGQLARIKEKIIAAWRQVVHRDGPPAARPDDRDGQKAVLAETLRKGLHEVGRIAHVILELHWLENRLAVEAAVEGDDSPQPARLRAILGELCGFLNALAAEETAEILDGKDLPEPMPTTPGGAEIVVMASGSSGAAVADILRKSGDPRLGAFAERLSKIGATHSVADQQMLDHLHACLSELTDGDCCATEKAGARHSKETRRRLKKAHDHLCAAGARCDGLAALADGGDEHGDDDDFGEKAARSGDLAKSLIEKAALAAALDEIVPRLDRLAKRVEDIAATPLPPLTMAGGTPAYSLSKRDDGGIGAAPDDIVAALARMSGEERTMALIKAAYANPIRSPG